MYKAEKIEVKEAKRKVKNTFIDERKLLNRLDDFRKIGAHLHRHKSASQEEDSRDEENEIESEN